MSKFYPKFIGLVQNKIRTLLSDKSIIINQMYQDTGIFGFVSGRGLKFYTDIENSHKMGLLPVLQTDLNQYWLSINIPYNTSTKTLKGISLCIYANDDSVKLFRAEWTNNESNINHAQPHWHIHAEKLKNGSKGWDENESEDFSLEEIEEPIREKIKRIHFAMAAAWHKKEDHIVLLSGNDNTELLNWIDGTLKYSIQQLEYIHDKSRN